MTVWMPMLGVIASIYLSLLKSDWAWFARSGAFLCFAGAALPIKSLLSKSACQHAKDNPGGFGFLDSTDYPPKKAIEEAKVGRIAFTIGLLGTLIWAYGDLILEWLIPLTKR